MKVLDKDLNINESADRCVYYANLHCVVPFEQPEMDAKTTDGAKGDTETPAVTTYKACLVSLSKKDYEALRPRFAWLPTDIIGKPLAVPHNMPGCPSTPS